MAECLANKGTLNKVFSVCGICVWVYSSSVWVSVCKEKIMKRKSGQCHVTVAAVRVLNIIPSILHFGEKNMGT